MKSSKALATLLVICGLIGIYVGIEILFFPVAFYSESGITLESNVSLMNELRASGGALLTCGVLILLGAFLQRLRFTAIVLSTSLYLSYGLSRAYSIVVDGKPAAILTYVAVAEVAIGLICVFVLFKYRGKE